MISAENLTSLPSQIRNVSIIGFGLMGAQIAQLFAQADDSFSIAAYDLDEKQFQRGLELITDGRYGLNRLITLNKMSETKKEQILERITTTSSLETAVQNSDLVIEAVIEVVEAKKEILERVSAFAPPNAIIASNTSTLTISGLASKLPTQSRSRTLGMHFFNPPQIMKLVEIVKHMESDLGVVEKIVTLSTRLGKTPIVVNDSPGFVANRIGLSVFLEASDLLEKGVASVRDIDTAMRLGYGYPMGPFELGDLVGLDARLRNLESMYQESKDERFKPPKILRKLVAEGYLGDPKVKKESKGGYYEFYGLERVRDSLVSSLKS